ncbi:MBL fold metallo-hydrolase [Bradyrhizobium sp. CCBAU 53415]|uniref:MBL fold metallo-hydrolase n=1 Tax=Bradyrhizobium sp. CCBAU 53415 TaxID=1325119 RepID=UPI0023051529|nr:MBL fold metallo-hydrolase [Bradyrhizobium sp. CCBAU 53415]MDA9469338.1 metallo-beta-lactamase family protein [Bradyrhizobium sp. CCBAU 53415]
MTQIPLSSAAEAEQAAFDFDRNDDTRQIVPDVAYRQLAIVNVIFVGFEGAGDGNWVLVDAGIPGSAYAIRSAAGARFGGQGRPACIVMTHAHFDHVGALETLANEWDVPVYAHHAEHPYLDGTRNYPPADPSVGGGLLALLSPLFPTRPVDVASRLYDLPVDHTVPFMQDWRWVPTPGHTPGHVSLWRERDRVLIAGDAFITTRQESVYAAMTQSPVMHGPPMYFTPDWASAKSSVRQLAALRPEVVVTGHGAAMQGSEMRSALDALAERFDEVAMPPHRRA